MLSIENSLFLSIFSRGRAKTQLAMVPRAIHTAKQTDKEEAKIEEDSKTTKHKMSNDDFRKMLSK